MATFEIIPVSHLGGKPFQHIPLAFYQMDMLERVYRGRQRYIVVKVIIRPFAKQVLSFG